jgi:hypothetical protein
MGLGRGRAPYQWGLGQSPNKLLMVQFINHKKKAFISMGQGRLSPLWVWAKPKVLPLTLLLSLYFQKRGGLGGCKPSQGFAFDFLYNLKIELP